MYLTKIIRGLVACFVLCVGGRALVAPDQYYPRTAVLEKGTTILAWDGVWKCSGEERMDVRQRSWGVGGVVVGK